ncbi:MAG: AMP-binding protein [Rhodospirillaceae bacterium]|nr:AMP-binding protein [Rhodospirillaceae bacterium]
MLIGDLVTNNARRNPAGEALIFEDRRVTWSQLNSRVNRLANALITLGLRPSDRVAYVLGNSIELIELYFAIAKAGGISIGIMPASVGREIAYIAGDVGAKIIVGGAEAAAAIGEASGELASLETLVMVGGGAPAIDYEGLIAAAADTEPGVAIDPNTVFAIKYTTGTTGFPKGCMRTHRQYLTNVLVYQAKVPHYPSDIALISMPISAGLGIHMMTSHAFAGIATVIRPKFDVADMLTWIAAERATMTYCILSLFDRLTDHPGLDQADLSSLRLLTGTSATGDSRPGMLRIKANPTFKGGFVNAYGSTETGGYVSYMLPHEVEAALISDAKPDRMSSLGTEAPLFRIEAVDEDGQPVAPGEFGEMIVSGPSMLEGYWNRPEDTAAVLKDGWLITGDVILKDEAGYIWLSGRKRDMVKTGGVNVYPAEIEAVLGEHPKVSLIAVVGVPDPKWGEKVVACAVADENCSAAELIDFCAGKLAGYKKPKDIFFFDALPTNAVGKLVKKDIAELAVQRNQASGT